jgi:ADP-heptose:LPS heptosyltransferase
MGFENKLRPIPPVDLMLTALEISEGYKILKQLVDNSRPTISIFTHATGKKSYPVSWWEIFYERLKQEYPGINIIEVLPIHNVSKLSSRAPTFYSRDIREIGSVIANTDLFIGADSGMMHLASASQTPTIGLFSVTSENLYGPYANNSVAINTNITDMEDWLKVINSILLRNPMVSEKAAPAL